MSRKFSIGDRVQTISLKHSLSGSIMQEAHDNSAILTVRSYDDDDRCSCDSPDLRMGRWYYDQRDLVLYVENKEDLITAHKEKRMTDQEFLDRLSRRKEESI